MLSMLWQFIEQLNPKVIALVGPIIAGCVVFFLRRIFERRPKLVSTLMETKTVEDQQDDGSNIITHIYTLLISNEGGKSANNLRISHHILPDIRIVQNINYRIEPLPGGGTDIVIPTLAPDQWIQIDYQFSPPTTWEEIVDVIRSDEVYVKSTMMPFFVRQPTLRKIFEVVIYAIFIFGIYIIWELFRYYYWNSPS